MQLIYSDDHRLRDAKTELSGGQLVPPFEKPSRLDFILQELDKVGWSDKISAPRDFGLDPILRIHDADYIRFLQTCWQDWLAAGFEGEAIADTSPFRNKAYAASARIPDTIDGKIGHYAMAAETSICDGTWEAAYASAQVALSAAELIATGAQSAFALCRPPGHHAHADMFGGYCFINNVAVAAQHLRDKGMDRVAILDVDFHHGNGTQDIFYDREDVLFVSIHGDPLQAFPYFLGHASETGISAGAGYNLNLPLPPGTAFTEWRKALATGLKAVEAFQPDALLVSLGVDTFEADPISFFKLTSDDFTVMGQDLKAANLPTLVVMEGGYAIDAIGVNTVNTLKGLVTPNGV